MEVGKRVKKRGSTFEGVIDKVADLGVKVTWDLGVEPKIRPLWCTPKELEVIA